MNIYINANLEGDYLEKAIDRIRELYRAGIDYELFKDLTSHQSDSRNGLGSTLKDWLELYKNKNIKIEENQLKLYLDYMKVYHEKYIEGASKDYWSRSNAIENINSEFLFERLILSR